MKIKAVLFARVSTREQAEEGYSLSAQERLLTDYADKRNLHTEKLFSVPESASGKHERKLFNALVTYVYERKDIKIVICEKVDRITRNLKDAVKLQDWINEDEERQIHFVKQNLVIHKNSRSNDQFMWDMFLVLARQYSNNLSEETKKGLMEKAEQGHYPGNHKRGYKAIGEIGHKVWLVDHENVESKFIRKAFELYDTGNHTIRTVSQTLFADGWKATDGKAVSISEMHILLSDPFYCGEFKWRKKLYTQSIKHEPLISKELFYRVQDRLTRKIKAGKYRKHNLLFGGGILTCGECGYSGTGDIRKGHHYYHCTFRNKNCTQRKYTTEQSINDQVKIVLNRLKITNPRLLGWVRKALHESHQDELSYHSDVMENLEKQRKLTENRLSVLYDDHVDGVIAKERYEQKLKQYESELRTISNATEKHINANISYLRLGVNIFELAQRGSEVYEDLKTSDLKREYLNFLFSNLKLIDNKVVPVFHNGFEVVAKRAEDGNWLRDMDSNHDRQSQNLSSCR